MAYFSLQTVTKVEHNGLIQNGNYVGLLGLNDENICLSRFKLLCSKIDDGNYFSSCTLLKIKIGLSFKIVF